MCLSTFPSSSYCETETTGMVRRGEKLMYEPVCALSRPPCTQFRIAFLRKISPQRSSSGSAAPRTWPHSRLPWLGVFFSKGRRKTSHDDPGRGKQQWLKPCVCMCVYCEYVCRPEIEEKKLPLSFLCFLPNAQSFPPSRGFRAPYPHPICDMIEAESGIQ